MINICNYYLDYVHTMYIRQDLADTSGARMECLGIKNLLHTAKLDIFAWTGLE